MPGLTPEIAVLPAVASNWKNGRGKRNDGKHGRRKCVCKEHMYVASNIGELRSVNMISVPWHLTRGGKHWEPWAVY